MPVFNQSRSRIILLIFLITFLVIIFQLFYLQVISGKYQQLAIDNAIFPKIIYPERGIIYDRKGKAILNNTISYDLMVVPAEVKNIDTAEFCRLMSIDIDQFKERMLEARIKNTSVRPSVFTDLLTPELQARFEENSWKFPGFTMVERPLRIYPYNAAAHILGYISEVDSKEIENSGNFYRMGDYKGKTGLEAYYENVLMGQRGVQYLIKDNRNRLVGNYENGAFDTAAIAGRGLRTYIDIELQQLAEKLMNNKVGGLVAIDPKTGGILAMVSGPNYNPNDLTGPDKSKNYSRLALDVKGPMLNRAVSGNYEPGSTFKPIGAMVALSEGVITPSFGYPCGGRYTLCGHGKPACTHSGGGHAANLRLSIANSCNSYYAHVYRLTVDNPKFGGVKKGYLKWKEYLSLFGLGVKTGVDLPGESNGNIADTSVYNKENNGHWTSCTNLTLGIGQDKMQTTPLQMANAICVIANKGYYYTPHFVERIEDETEEDTALMNRYRIKHEVLTDVPDTAFNAVIEGMNDVVKFGTARIAQIPGIDVCAKTGTAENYRIIDRKRVKLPNNSMFVCFAPKQNPRIAIACFVQNAGFGSTWAGPISRILIEKYLNDTLQTRSVADVERISNTNLIPAYFKRLQYTTDSTRAYKWLEQYKDSSLLKRFLKRSVVSNQVPEKSPFHPEKEDRKKSTAFVLQTEKKTTQNNTKKTT
ncbi:MAG TPA: penicillin-binding protein 2 [Chitinophagaceae bacterium]|nr:penicillin-binding protein 2 [Chitinophagaceae bacterium]MCB9055389.1 penicillin-binding protein 2 [Chitinophagales bacterium]HPG12405.1 penicillin-binding protein 2 [Chitinophagaceae bacterium]HRX93181.1 penicillin-binding protein 2 [Chitinophagaceae bacterium]